jgi:hypothetical protein
LARAARDGPLQSQKEFEDLLFAMRTDLNASNLYPLRGEIQKLLD